MALSSDIIIQQVHSHSDMQKFLTAPYQLYRNIEGYIPPFLPQQKILIHPSIAPFYKRGQSRHFLAWRDGQVVGRIMAHIDPLALKQWDSPIGMIGAFDCFSDQQIADSLLSTACHWLSDQGMTKVQGP